MNEWVVFGSLLVKEKFWSVVNIRLFEYLATHQHHFI